MNTLVIYDESGVVIATMSGEEYGAVGTAVIDVPDGKEVSHVNTDTGEVILKPRAKTAAQQLETLRKAAMVTASKFSDEEAAAVPDLYPAWEPNETVAVGDRRYDAHTGKLYKCLQAHTTQPDWKPVDVPALWAEI